MSRLTQNDKDILYTFPKVYLMYDKEIYDDEDEIEFIDKILYCEKELKDKGYIRTFSIINADLCIIISYENKFTFIANDEYDSFVDLDTDSLNRQYEQYNKLDYYLYYEAKTGKNIYKVEYEKYKGIARTTLPFISTTSIINKYDIW